MLVVTLLVHNSAFKLRQTDLFLKSYSCIFALNMLLAVASTRDFAGSQACRLPYSPKLTHQASPPLNTWMWKAYLLLKCIIAAELWQIIINKQILHVESLWKDKQFLPQSLSVDDMKRLKRSRSFYIRRWEQSRRLNGWEGGRAERK